MKVNPASNASAKTASWLNATASFSSSAPTRATNSARAERGTRTMPRILGVDLPNDKPTHIALRYIYGIGPTLALVVCEKARVDPLRRAKELSDEDIARIATILDREYTVEGPLRRQVHQ